jgi:unsaturated rhamnogalacturonyl hydrolase
MTQINRREALKLGLSLSAATSLISPSALFDAPAQDWSEGVIATTMHRMPTAKDLPNWGYAVSLFLYGQYLVYQRTHDKRHLEYIQAWVDRHISTDGVIDRKIDALDYMLPGNLLLVLYKETNQQKYENAADSIRKTFDTYPRTQDGGLWHAYSRQHQLWLDGMFMSMPFLVRYGALFNDLTYACDEAAKQLLIYARHLNDPTTGLMFHAYDESANQPWAAPPGNHSAYFWCRAIGWFGMALIEVLEIMPQTHPQRPALITQLRQLCTAYQKYQDPATGLWHQIVDKATLPGNWLETSSSSMYTYTMSRAIERGYITKQFAPTIKKGYAGVLTKLSRDPEGFAHIADICEGTNVADLEYYLNRTRSTDDFHGLGAFLIMNEQLRKKTT